jgi:hypothetical protein
MNPLLPGTLLAAWLGLGALAETPGTARAASLDFTRAIVVETPDSPPLARQAATVLIEEVEKRTGLRWERRTGWPTNPGPASAPVIALGSTTTLDAAAGRFATDARPRLANAGPEGFLLMARGTPETPTALVLGRDLRGVMFGVGRLLRELRLRPGHAELPDALDVVSTPRTPLRGHQLGYRPKTHSYDAWDLPVWEQYFRDLVVFGCNAVELVPPRSDDDADSPHFPRPPMDMMIGMSRLADTYGLDVWVWYPAMDPDYGNPATIDAALAEWAEVFRRLPRLDAVFVPGGDPGHTAPRHLMTLLARQTENLRRFHPNAQMWVSPQGFTAAWMDEFLEILNRDQPPWLHGLVFGPQVRLPLPQLRQRVPARYPIRHYPDITHTRQCQYPVPDWDVAYAVTEARECINPRPLDQAAIFRATARDTLGFITYSEGCNDDVNKTVWSALGWDPEADPAGILRDYARYFVGEPHSDAFAQGLLALERNWRGPLLANAGVEVTLRQFQALERAASPRVRRNWRFQQALFRAYYDAYVRRRLVHETELEAAALERLRQAPDRGPAPVMAEAESILDRALTDPVALDWRQRLGELGEALFQSIAMQLSVPKHLAIAVDRGASLDTLDFPLNNRPWLREEFARIRRLRSSAEQRDALARLVDWENPGPGGFYDDLGNPARQPHLVPGTAFAEDPGRLRSPRVGFEEDPVLDDRSEPPSLARRVSWMDQAETLYDTPLQVRYTDLDPQARYRLRVVYAGDAPKRRVRLTAGDGIEIHPPLTRPLPLPPAVVSPPARGHPERPAHLELDRRTGPGRKWPRLPRSPSSG